jgi:hypothetical protein
MKSFFTFRIKINKMRITFLISLTLTFLSFISCDSGNKPSPKLNENSTGNNTATPNIATPNPNTATVYEKSGVSFSIPAGWKQMEAPIPGEQGESMGAYIMIEKSGEDESGQFIASLLDSKIPLKEYMDLVKKQLTESLSIQKAEIKYSEVSEENFNGAKALVCNFEHNSAGLDFRGELMAFYCGNRTIQIFIQEAKADAAKNKSGLDMLSSSFICK